MRLRLIDRVRRFLRRGSARSRGPVNGNAATTFGAGRHRRDYPDQPLPRRPPGTPPGPPPAGAPAGGRPPAPPPPGTGGPLPRRAPRPPAPGRSAAGPSAAGPPATARPPGGPDRAAIRPAPGRAAPGRAAAGRTAAGRGADPGRGAARDAAAQAQAQPASSADAAGLAWYEVAYARRAAEGYADCGPLEQVLRREWPAAEVPSAPVVRAVSRLAQLPQMIKEILAAGLDAIHVGDGGVPDLDDMSRLRGIPLPSGRATWDACAGAYGERKIIVGSRPSAAPDVMCHEVGHALDDIDRVNGTWQSDSTEFRRLYDRCQEALVSDFHKQAGNLGRREFFADAFAAIASRQRPALVDMLGGNTRPALDVMLYFNRRYGL